MAIITTTADALLKKGAFAELGVAVRRNNYDGTAVRTTRNLTRNVPVNLSEAMNEGKYPVQIGNTAYIITAIDKDSPVLWKADLSSAADITAVTPNELAIILNALVNVDTGATISEWQANIDPGTKACNFRCIKPGAKYAQVFGVFAGAIGIGGGYSPYTNLGNEFVDLIKDDDTITVASTLQKSDATNVDQTGSENGLTRIVVPGQVTGVQYAINIKPHDYRLRQIMEGGKLTVEDEGTVHYQAPASGVDFDVGKVGVEMFKVDPLYPANATSNKGEEIAYLEQHCFRGNVEVADESSGAMTLTSYNYTFTAGVYIDEQGKRWSQPDEHEFNLNSWSTHGLTEASQNKLTINMFDIIPVTDFTLQASVSILAHGTASNPVTLTPDNANHFKVAFSTLSTLNDTTLTWDATNREIDIASGSDTGTESVTVTITNADATTVAKTFSITVS